MTDSDALARHLADLRKQEELLKSAKKALIEQLEQSLDYQMIQDNLKDISNEIELAEHDLRQYILADCVESGSKSHKYGGYKEVRKVWYDIENAVTWCGEHLQKALKLDSRTFEKYCRAMDEKDLPLPDCAKVEIEQQPFIKSDLSFLLESE